MRKHLIFFDGSCGLCDHAVQFVLRRDEKGSFLFAPLQGKTAKALLDALPGEDSFILIEDYNTLEKKVFQLGQGAFRTLWLMGGMWKCLGWISFLPPIFYNWGYRLVAKNRKRFFSKDSCQLPDKKKPSRFLP